MNNVKEILLSSPKSLEQAFMEVDPKNSGRVTNLMFKKAFRNLNIALTSKEIDLLLNYCDFKLESLINWREFVKILNLKEEKQQIIDRLSSKIQHLSDLLHYYMISPKDAFRKVRFMLFSGTTRGQAISIFKNFISCSRICIIKQEKHCLNINS